MTNRILMVLGVLLSLPVLATGQNPKTPRPKTDSASIDSYAKQVDQYIKRKRNHHRTFGNVGSEDESDRWNEFKEKVAEGETDPSDLDEQAYVWMRAGKVVAAAFTFQSGSRDWAHFVTYYFREDGTLAKIHAQLNTFYGNVSVVRDKSYNSSGKLLRSTTKYLDLQTQKPIKTANFQEEPIPVYRNVRELPFFRLL